MLRSKPLLPPDTERALARVARALRAGVLRQATLDDALTALDALPPRVGAEAESRIALAAGLFRQPQAIRRGALQRLFFRRDPDGPAPTGLPYLHLFHRNGYLREQALQGLDGGVRSPFFVAAIAYRLNDWVPQVRQAALACAARTFPLTNADIVAEAATSLLGRSRSWRRWGDGAEILEATFERPEVVQRIALRLKVATTGPMASVLRNAARRPLLDGHLEALATDAMLPSVRALAAQMLIDGKASWPCGFRREWINKIHFESRRVIVFDERALPPGPPREALIAQAARDRSAIVRRMAAAALIRHRDTLKDLDALIDLLADDPRPGVSGRIAFLRRQEAGR